MEGPVVAVGPHEQLEGLAFDDPFPGNIIYHNVRKVRLTGQRTERRKLRAGQTHDVMLAQGGVSDALQYCVGRVGRWYSGLAKEGEVPVRW